MWQAKFAKLSDLTKSFLIYLWGLLKENCFIAILFSGVSKLSTFCSDMGSDYNSLISLFRSFFDLLLSNSFNR